MITKRLMFLIPLACLTLSGCPQQRKVREKASPVTTPSTAKGKKAPVTAGTKKSGTKKAPVTKPGTPGTKKAPPGGTPKKVGGPSAPNSKDTTSSKYQCTVAGNCILENQSCCPACLGASVATMQAMNKVQWKKFQKECKSKKVECKRCKNPGFNANFVVLCEANKCVVRDFRATPHAKCTQNSDCVLRAAPCCDCSGPPVALSKAGLATYQQARCGSKKCKACKAGTFNGVSAACIKGRCMMKGYWKKKATGGPAGKAQPKAK